jgi:transcriptional regulator with PAS, ATPase and Fis domain
MDRNFNLLSVSEQSPAEIKSLELGSSIDRCLSLQHLQALIMKGFSFKNLPVLIGQQWYAVENVPGENSEEDQLESVRLEFFRYKNKETAFVLHDFVQAMDPFSLDAAGGILLVDRRGTILLVNSEFADILGLQTSEMVGRHVNEVYPDKTLSRLPKVIETGKAEVGEAHVLNGRKIVASRWPLIKDGKAFGAYGKAVLRETLDAARNAGRFLSAEAKSGRHSIKGHRPKSLYDVDQIICHGQTMKDIKSRLLKVAGRSSTIMLSGESGTGKELFAHAIHAASNRSDGPFVRVNCAAIPENLLESELFGYVEGAFSGARRGGQIGKFEQAHGGTLFLDEISEMPMSMQAKLLRVMQEREVAPLGSQDIRFVNVRFVVATNCDALSLVKENKLRADLYYRINVVSLPIPPLRERVEDVFYLARHFVEHFNHEFDMNVQGLSSRAWAALKAYPFPGNVRELRSAIESAFNMVDGPFVRLYDLPVPIAEMHTKEEGMAEGSDFRLETMKSFGEKSLQEIMEEIEKDLIVRAMEKVGGNKLVAAGLLGISRPGLYKKLQKYNLQ